jgi:hypothetical protein
VKHTWTDSAAAATALAVENRAAEREPLTLPGRLTWKDERGAARFVSVVTCDVSPFGVFVECRTPVSIPLYRLVQFQLERATGEEWAQVPAVLRQGRVLSAVYRVKPATRSGEPQGLALRLLVDPRRQPADARRQPAGADTESRAASA